MRIAIVDDQDELYSQLTDFSERSDFKFHYYSNPKKALKEIPKKNFDFLIFDWNMPEMLGSELFKELKIKMRMPPTIFISSNATEGDIVREVLEMGADDFIPKSMEMDRDMYVKRIEVMIERYSQINFKAGIWFDDYLNSITINDLEIKLLSLEYRILKLITHAKDPIISRDDLIHILWDGKKDFASFEEAILGLFNKLGKYQGLIKMNDNNYSIDYEFWDWNS